MDLERVQALLALDLAVERLANVVYSDALTLVKESEPQHGIRHNWNKLLETASEKSEEIIGQPIPYVTELKNMHKARNLAQHSGHAPSAQVLIDAGRHTRLMFETVFRDGYGLDVEIFSVAALIQDPALQRLFDDVEAYIAVDDHDAAAVGLRIAVDALTYAISRSDRSGIGDRPSSFDMSIPYEQSGFGLGKALKDYMGYMERVVADVRREIIFVSLGRTALESRRVFALLTRLPPAHAGPDGNRASQDEVVYLSHFFLGLALRAQAHVADVGYHIPSQGLRSLVEERRAAHEERVRAREERRKSEDS